MGWTEYRASYFKSGKIDRKAECDAYFLEGHNRGHFDVLKSVVIGSVYYAAIKDCMRYLGESDGKSVYESIEDGKIWCAILLTSIRGDYFSYKYMDETVIPYYYDCPESILKLLSDTNNENALKYRRLCREKKKEKKKRSLSALPVGTVIKWKIGETERVAYKHEAAYQFKRPFWMAMDDSRYYKKRKSVITGKFWRKIMEKYCVTVAGPFEEEVYPFNSNDPKEIIKKWFEQEKAHALCTNIQAATREDALMLLTWAFENIEYVKKQYPGCHYRWNYICDGIEKEISEKCKSFQWEWDSVFPFCMG